MTESALTINLHSSIYEHFHYPAGEAQVRIKPEYIDTVANSSKINVLARLYNEKDIIETVLLMDAIGHVTNSGCDDGNVSLILPYLPYSRADRRFTSGDCFGFLCFANILRIMDEFCKFNVITLDAHSEVATKQVVSVVNVSPEPIIYQAIKAFADLNNAKLVCVLFPDDGASKRYALRDMIGNNGDTLLVLFLRASKKRDPENGKFLGFDVPEEAAFQELPVLIVDDLCDAGGTFLGIRALLPKRTKVGLYTTHGIYSKGMTEIRANFDWIACTNSFKTVYSPNPPDRVYDADALLLRAANSNLEKGATKV